MSESGKNDDSQDQLDGFDEIADILTSFNCPLIQRQDRWWLEELLFQPGQPRTDFLKWILVIITDYQSSFGLDGSESILNSTMMSNLNSTVSNNNNTLNMKYPETDEGIHEWLSNAGVCPHNDMSFVKGTLPMQKQLKCWKILIKPLLNVYRPNKNMQISLGIHSMNSLLAREDFHETFSNLKADFLPADVKSELGRFERKKAAKQQQMGDSQVTQANTSFMLPAFDGAYLKNLSNEVERMKLNSERFATIFHDELKMCLPKDQPKLEMLNIGEQSEMIKNKMSEWQKSTGSLLKLTKGSLLESNKKKLEILLERNCKDLELHPYEKLIENN